MQASASAQTATESAVPSPSPSPLLPEHHNGIDFAIPEGTDVLVVDDGIVTQAGQGDYGLTIVVKHSWGESVYGHLSKVNVQIGQNTSKNDIIALSGSTGISTGPHLHFGVRPNNATLTDEYFGFVDPSSYLGLSPEIIQSNAGSQLSSVSFEDVGSDNLYLFNYKYDIGKGVTAHFFDKAEKRPGFAIADSEYDYKLRFFLKDYEKDEVIASPSANTLEFPVKVSGTDATLRYSLSQPKVKEDLILSKKPEINPEEDFKVNFEMQSVGLSIEKEGKEHVLKSQDGTVYWRLLEPTVIDANGKTGKITLDIKEATDSASSCLLVEPGCSLHNVNLVVDSEFLKTAVYPVVIDPTVFTNNGAAAADVTPSQENISVLDVSISAPASDTFLDSDGTDTTGAGTAAAITAGDTLKALAMESNALCGNTDGTTAPGNIVLDTDGECTGNESSTSPDTTGNVGQNPSIVLDSSGFPVVSYEDTTNNDLRVMHCNDVNCSGGDESIETVDSTDLVGERSSIALDASGFPVIAYYKRSGDVMRLLHCNDANCAGGNESIEDLDSAGAANGGQISLALDADGFPVVALYQFNGGAFKIVHCNDANCSGGNESVQTISASGAIGRGLSLVLDSSGFPVVSFYDETGRSGDGSLLKLLHCNDANCAGGNESTETVGSSLGALFSANTSLKLDSSGFPVISYWEATNNDLKVAHCNDANCAGENESIVSPDTEGSVGRSSSLVLDSSGFPVVAYRDATNASLKVLHCGDANCSSGNTATSPDTADNPGNNPSLVLDSSGFPVVAHYESTNDDLKVLHCSDASCLSSDARTVVLGSDSSAATSLVSSTSRITFVDTNADDDWDSGEDIYFDTDDSNLYNADAIDALTTVNTGTAVNSTDIALVKLWLDDGDGSFSSSTDTAIDADCTYNASTANWECDVSTTLTASVRIFVTVSIASSPTHEATITMKIPTKSDANSNGAFSTGDKGIFLASDQDGPASDITNANTQTIIVNITPSTPTSLGPEGLVNGTKGNDITPTFNFTITDADSGDTLKFQIQVDDTSSFSSPAVDYTSALSTQGAKDFTVGQEAGSGTYTAGSTSQTLTNNTSYYWRVRATDNGDAIGSYATANSGSAAFIVDTAYYPPKGSTDSSTSTSSTSITTTTTTTSETVTALTSALDNIITFVQPTEEEEPINLPSSPPKVPEIVTQISKTTSLLVEYVDIVKDSIEQFATDIFASLVPDKLKELAVESSRKVTILLGETKNRLILAFTVLTQQGQNQISDVAISHNSKTSVTVSWKTKYPGSSKVNYGFDTGYGLDKQSGDLTTNHSIFLDNLEPDKTYYFEVMSQGKDYVYDAYYTFTTPSK